LGRRAVFADALLEMMKMTNPKIFDELHDAYIIAAEVDHLSNGRQFASKAGHANIHPDFRRRYTVPPN
jgi:hypothetical protein